MTTLKKNQKFLNKAKEIPNMNIPIENDHFPTTTTKALKTNARFLHQTLHNKISFLRKIYKRILKSLISFSAIMNKKYVVILQNFSKKSPKKSRNKISSLPLQQVIFHWYLESHSIMIISLSMLQNWKKMNFLTSLIAISTFFLYWSSIALQIKTLKNSILMW